MKKGTELIFLLNPLITLEQEITWCKVTCKVLALSNQVSNSTWWTSPEPKILNHTAPSPHVNLTYSEDLFSWVAPAGVTADPSALQQGSEGPGVILWRWTS